MLAIFERDSTKTEHSSDMQRDRIYSMEEDEKYRNWDAYRRFKQKPYYMEGVNENEVQVIQKRFSDLEE